jgi:hypothetical protein
VDGNLFYGLSSSYVLPSTNLFTPDSVHAMRQGVLKSSGFAVENDINVKCIYLGSWLLEKAMVDGWIGWNDVGVTPAQMANHLRQASPQQRVFILGNRSCRVDDREYHVERIDDLILCQLRWLRDLNCLDLVDRTNLIEQIRSVQVLSVIALPGQPPIHDWRNACGLFYTPNFLALQDTYCNLAALEILGGLDKIDREACIEGILRMHRGKGLFTSPNGVIGDARDTFCAFESLRILGALDRVKDLDHWQFRVMRASKHGPSRKLTWDEIEAWVCQQRFERFLREWKENPQSPPRSLLEN